MRVTVKNYKKAEWASEETDCYEASVYLDGKKVGSARNEGRGGPDFISIDKEHRSAWHEAVEEWILSVQDERRFRWIDGNRGEWVCFADEETLIHEACEIWQRESRLRKEVKRAISAGYKRAVQIERQQYDESHGIPLGREIFLSYISEDPEVLEEVIKGDTLEGDRIWVADPDGIDEISREAVTA